MFLNDQLRQTVRGPVNPLDKATVFSICPKPIKEHKPTISPGLFIIPAGTLANPSRLVVGPSSWWREIDENQPLLEIPNGSIQVAESIVNDYCNGLLACNMSNAMPGLFFIPGDITVDMLKKDFKKALDVARIKQEQWFRGLVNMADTLWARTNGNPLTIGDDMRMAAKELGLTSKDWMTNFNNIEMIRCLACGAMRNPLYPMCGNCKTIIDVSKAKELGIAIQS